MSRVLVTGAAGFIGSHLLPKLVDEGYEVIALDRPEALAKLNTEDYHGGKIHRVEADICDIPYRWSFGATRDVFGDSVIHLAAMAAPRVAEKTPDETFRTNVYGTYNVLRMAKEADVKRFIFTSTAHVYGISPKYMPTDEVHPLSLGDAYTTSKILGEQLCELFYENHKIPYVVLRLFNGYGPRQSTDYFIPSMISQAMKGEIALRGGPITKDFVYVEDIVDAMVKALSSDYVGELNVGTGIQTTLSYVAGRIAEYFNASKVEYSTDDRGPTHMQCDPSRAKRILGWEAKTSIYDGLSKTCHYFKSVAKSG